MLTDCEKRQINDRLLALIDKLQTVRDLVEMDEPALARVQLMDTVGQLQRVNLKITSYTRN